MVRKTIITDAAPKAIGPYSQAVDLGDYVFLSGQIPLDPVTQKQVEGGIDAQTERVLKNLEEVLSAAGLGLGDVVGTPSS